MSVLRTRLMFLILELLIVIGCVLVGRHVGNHHNFIPASILFVPLQTVATFFLPRILVTFLITFFLIFVLSAKWIPANVFADSRAFAARLFALALGITLSAVYIYLFSGAPFNPSLFIATGGSLLIVYLVGYLFESVRSGKGLSSSLASLIVDTFRQSIRPTGILVIAIGIAPIALMVAYSLDRNVADYVTRVRMQLTPEDKYVWGFENALGDQLLPQPIDFRFDPEDSQVVYVLSRVGELLRVHRRADFAPEVLLDLSEAVGVADVELGALGLALHPQFSNPQSPDYRRVFIYYTHFVAPGTSKQHPGVIEGSTQTNRLSEFDLKPATPEARRASEKILMDLGRPSSGSHNGGSIGFGPDGFLYVAIGESTVADSHGTIDRHLFGGILRIDVDMIGGEISAPIQRQPEGGITQGYYIPKDNPFVEVEGALGEFFAFGLRNPFRFTFDEKTGELWAGDVGSLEYEEVNLIESGGNYQYPYVEGYEEQGPRPATSPGKEVTPVFVYPHTALDRAIIGGVRYRGPRQEINALYIFGDNYSGKIFAIDPQASAILSRTLARLPEVAMRGLAAIRTSPSGEILMATLGHQQESTGRILSLLPMSEISIGVTAPVAVTDEGPIDGAAIYLGNCALCHGRDGKGESETASALQVAMPDFSTKAFHAKRTDESIARVVSNGGAAEGLNAAMPPWNALLSEAEINALVAYLRTLQSED